MADRLISFEATEDQDQRAVELGLMTEDERIRRAYERILREQLRRGRFGPRVT